MRCMVKMASCCNKEASKYNAYWGREIHFDTKDTASILGMEKMISIQMSCKDMAETLISTGYIQ